MVVVTAPAAEPAGRCVGGGEAERGRGQDSDRVEFLHGVRFFVEARGERPLPPSWWRARARMSQGSLTDGGQRGGRKSRKPLAPRSPSNLKKSRGSLKRTK